MKNGLSSVVLAVAFAVLVCSPVHAQVKRVEGKVSGKVFCSVEWEKKASEYQGTDVVCHDPKHERMIVTEKGEVYHLEPAEGAGKEVKKLIQSEAYEKKNVTIEGEIVKKGIMKVIKVKGFKVKE